MRRDIGADRSGTMAIEFALLAPVFLAMAWGALALGLAFWTENALQQTASETARCIAIGAPGCTAAGASCGSTTVGECYFRTLAARRGIGNVTADQLTVDRTAKVGNVSFTTVTVTYPYALMGYAFQLKLTGHFPNLT